MDSREMFKRMVYEGVDQSAIVRAAQEMRGKRAEAMPPALAHLSGIVTHQMALVLETAGVAYDLLAPTMDGQGQAISAAVLGLDEAANAISEVAMDHPELFPVVEGLVATHKRLAPVLDAAWTATYDTLLEAMANTLGLGRKVLRGQAEFSLESQQELASIVSRMQQDGEAHAMLIFLHGGGESLNVGKLAGMAAAGTFPTQGYPSPTPLDCERYVAWAKSRHDTLTRRISEARKKYGYPVKEVMDMIYAQDGEQL